MKLGTTSRCQPSTVRDSNHALVARSRMTTARVSQSQRRRAGIVKSPLPVGGCHLGEHLGLCLSLAVELRIDRQSGGKPRQSKGPYVVACAAAPSISVRASLQRSQMVG